MVEVMLAHSYDPTKHNVEGWWWSEKLDGVRAYWDGKQFLTRNGNVLPAPEYFTKGMPPYPLDGELWVGRGRFQDTVSIVRSEKQDKGWGSVTYWVFDLPTIALPFEVRQTMAIALLEKYKLPHVQWLNHQVLDDPRNIPKVVKRVLQSGGEGIMLRRPGSAYEAKRSSALLKVKDAKDDVAEVIGHEPGKGKHTGRLGALVCKMIYGHEQPVFNIGTGFTDAQRESPPAIGSRVKFIYTELTRDGVPRFPRFLSEEF